jgi:Uma2 family endonuclease
MTPTIQQNLASLVEGSATVIPSLEAGDYYRKDEFLRRYEARPDIKKAELIENIVYMASPAREDHSEPETLFAYVLTTFSAETPFVTARSNMTVHLSAKSVVQPDWYLRIEAKAGGRAAIGKDRYLNKPPELVVEVAATSASYDLHPKKDAYEQAGAPEYIVWEAFDFRLSCFARKGNAFENARADGDGVYRSRMFPGLWFDIAGFTNGDMAAVKACLQRGIASPEHSKFVARLKKRAEGGK